MPRFVVPTLALAGMSLLPLGCGGSSTGTGAAAGGSGNPPQASVRLFESLATARGASNPSVAAASEDGWLFLGEGGMLSFLRPDDPGGFEQAFKRVAIGHPGVRPMEIVADPGLDLADGFDDDDLLYIAGGRLGLWVMRVTDIPAPNGDDRAFRVDDSEGGDPNVQDSRRLCNDLELLEVGGRTFLAAMFGAKNDNRLRLYDLEQVRTVAASVSETGNELAPLLEVVIGENAAAGIQAHAGLEFPGIAFGTGLALDGISADEVDVYLAMNYAGLARVTLTTSILTAQNPVPPAPSWGPAFGTGTPQHALNERLRDMRYHDRGFDGEASGPPVRVDPPPCRDVAVQHDAAGHFLYVAAEQAGWLRYDISDRSAFAPGMPVDYHQFPDPGPPQGPTTNALCKVAPGSPDNMFTTRIAYLYSAAGPLLAVTCSFLPHPFLLTIRTDGRLLDSTAGRFAGVHRDPELAEIQATFCATLLYDLKPLDGPAPPEVLPELGSWPFGHEHLSLRTDPADPDVVVLDTAACGPVEAGTSASGLAAARIRHDIGAGTFEVVAREPRDFSGRKCKMAGASLVHPDVILTASNDGGLPADGFLQVCDGQLTADYECFPCDDGIDRDGRTAHGAIWNPDAQWVPEFLLAQPFSELVAGQGPEHGQQGHTLRFDYLRVGNPERDPCLTFDSPDLLARWDFKQVNDALDQQAQRFLWGEIDARYDEENLADIDALFMGMSAIGDGIAVINRTVLERFFAFHLPPAGAAGSDLIQFMPFGEVGASDDRAHVGHLLTHREYYQVHVAAPEVDRERFNLKSRLLPWNGAPQLFRIPGASGSAPATWVLAAPSGSIAFPPDHPVVQDDGELYGFGDPPRGFVGQHPAWAPAPRYGANNGRALVQFFDVSDPKGIARDAHGIAVPLAEKEIIGPDPEGGAITIQVLQIGEDAALRTFLFVADFAGRVLVYDWDELDDAQGNGNQDKVFARHEVLPSVTDHLPGGNVYNVLVDRVLTEDASGPREFYYVYVPVTRVGIEVLRFDPDAAPAERFSAVQLIETPVDPHWVQLRVDERGPGEAVKSLVVTDQLGGIRIYEYGDARPAPQ